MKSFKRVMLFLSCGVLVSSCVSDKNLAEKMKKVMKENPEVLVEAIKNNPVEFVEALQAAAKDARDSLSKRREEDEKKKFEASFSNPLKPTIRKDESIRGTKGAPIVLVEYSDFECPFCTRGFNTVNELLKKYKGKIQFVYKHLPLSFHRNAMIASQYYEGIRLENEEKAFAFHDYVFANQDKLKLGEKFLKKAAKKVGANMGKLAKSIKSKSVLDRIKEDQEEAAKFGMQGTPGFLLNGIPVKGAYPTSHFENIVAQLKERGLIKI